MAKALKILDGVLAMKVTIEGCPYPDQDGTYEIESIKTFGVESVFTYDRRGKPVNVERSFCVDGSLADSRETKLKLLKEAQLQHGESDGTIRT